VSVESHQDYILLYNNFGLIFEGSEEDTVTKSTKNCCFDHTLLLFDTPLHRTPTNIHINLYSDRRNAIVVPSSYDTRKDVCKRHMKYYYSAEIND